MTHHSGCKRQEILANVWPVLTLARREPAGFVCQLRHSALTHDAEEGIGTPMLIARSGHTPVRSQLSTRACPPRRPPATRPSAIWHGADKAPMSARTLAGGSILTDTHNGSRKGGAEGRTRAACRARPGERYTVARVEQRAADEARRLGWEICDRAPDRTAAPRGRLLLHRPWYPCTSHCGRYGRAREY